MTGDAPKLAHLVDALAATAAPPGVRTRIVAVDGCAGAGKSSLAAWLARTVNAQVVSTDDFASWDEPLEWWPIFIKLVLEPLAAGRSVSYQPRSWGGEAKDPVLVEPGWLVAIEGVGASQQALRSYLAYTIWVDTPRELRLGRGLDRDGNEARRLWERWMSAEDAYLNAERPHERADIVLRGDLDLWQ